MQNDVIATNVYIVCHVNIIRTIIVIVM